MTAKDEGILFLIRREIGVLRGLIQGCTFGLFLADERTKRSVYMTMVNIGGLMQGLTIAFRSNHGEVLWEVIVRLREDILKKYVKLHLPEIWGLVTEEMLPLEEYIGDLIEMERRADRERGGQRNC